MALTKAQARVLNELVKRGGTANPYELAYPRTPLLRRLRNAKFITLGKAPIYDEFNCIMTITDAGRSALKRGMP